MVIVTIANQKGGVGKTTTALNLAYALVELGRSCLVIDLDPQASLTQACGVDPSAGSLADVLGGAAPGRLSMAEVIRPLAPGVDLAPATKALVDTELYINNRYARESILKKALVGLRYDFCLIDCAPSLSLLVINALTAAHGVIAPVVPDELGLRGLVQFLESLEAIRAELNPQLDFIGCLVTQFEQRQTLHRLALEDLRAGGVKVLPMIIPRRAALARSAGKGQPVKLAELAAYYTELAEYLISWRKKTNL